MDKFRSEFYGFRSGIYGKDPASYPIACFQDNDISSPPASGTTRAAVSPAIPASMMTTLSSVLDRHVVSHTTYQVIVQFSAMTTDIHWQAIALRLLLTIIAGTILGAERSKSGHPAGLRTTLLVMLAASIAMIQMNILIQTNGKPHDSYTVMDLMRLPLGILTGVGFIGAGAIVRKDGLVLGITTAATMWFVTVVGLCFGGGQLVLGATATILGFLVLWALRFGEGYLETHQRAILTLMSDDENISVEAVSHLLHSEKIHVKSTSAFYEQIQHRHRFRFEVRWHRSSPADLPDAIEHLRQMPGVISCEWNTGD